LLRFFFHGGSVYGERHDGVGQLDQNSGLERYDVLLLARRSDKCVGNNGINRFAFDSQ